MPLAPSLRAAALLTAYIARRRCMVRTGAMVAIFRAPCERPHTHTGHTHAHIQALTAQDRGTTTPDSREANSLEPPSVEGGGRGCMGPKRQ